MLAAGAGGGSGVFILVCLSSFLSPSLCEAVRNILKYGLKPKPTSQAKPATSQAKQATSQAKQAKYMYLNCSSILRTGGYIPSVSYKFNVRFPA